MLAQRRFRPHVLSEPEERALGERDPAAVSAWQALYAQTTSTIEVPFDAGDGDQPHTIDRLLAYVHDPRRDVRLRSLETLYAALEPRLPVLAHCYDSLVGDRLVLDRLRVYGDDPMAPTHLQNELDGEVVYAMMEAVESRYALAQRWFVAKAPMLGIDRLELADQYAPVGEARRWTTTRGGAGRRLVLGLLAAHARDRRAASSPSSGWTPSRGRASAAAPSARRSPRMPGPT